MAEGETVSWDPAEASDAIGVLSTYEELGSIGKTSCAMVRTDRPWELDIDAIVLSYGTIPGSLADAVQDQFPDADWGSIPLSRLTPAAPFLLDIPGSRHRSRLRMAVAATTHPDGKESSSPTPQTVGEATVTAIEVAAQAGATAIGMPVLGTGALHLSVDDVAEVVVPAVARMLDETPDTAVRRLVLFFQDQHSAEIIRSLWGAVAARLGRGATLAGGFSTERVDPNVGIQVAGDQLGVAPYVSMLATVIADRNTPLPLSVGIFGEWGSGKSTFMGMLRHQVAELAGAANSTYCDKIAQIGFNAWHYADSNLWASLADEIFRQLAGPGPSGEERRQLLRDKLATGLDQWQELETARRRAEETTARLQASVDAAEATRERTSRDLIVAMKGSAVFNRKLDALWSRLGIRDQIAQGRLLAEQMRGTLHEADALRRAPHDRRGRLTIVVSAVVLVLCVVIAVFAPELRLWLAGVVAAVATAVGTYGIPAMNRARAGLRALRELSEDLHAGVDRASRERVAAEVSEQVRSLRRAEAEQRLAEARLEEVVSHVGEVERQRAELSSARRLYAFLAERAQAEPYQRNLGLISTIRKDFEQLVTLMNDARDHPDMHPELPAPVERIVLYIDDLDRCNPRQVVQVLEAVHLLLALDLFVVVVGVDPRWLLRSLCSHYDEVLDGAGSSVSREPDSWRVTPEDYLEKILNIPLVLPGMPSGSLSSLLRSLVEEGTPTQQVAAQPSGRGIVESRMSGTSDAGAPEIETGSEVDVQQRPQVGDSTPRPLTEPELELLSELDFLVDTPREAKRLFNLYRMVRATRDLSVASRFLGDDGGTGEFQAVVVLLGLLTAHGRLLGSVLDSPPDPDTAVLGGLMCRQPETAWVSFVHDLDPVRFGHGWANRIVGSLSDPQVAEWSRLYCGLTRVCSSVTLNDLSSFQAWVPRIRRFSYVLPPAETVSPRCRTADQR